MPSLPAQVDGICRARWELGAETTRVDAFVRAGAKGWPWLAGSMRRLRAARGNEVYDLDIMKNVVVEAAAYINCLIDPWAIAAEC